MPTQKWVYPDDWLKKPDKRGRRSLKKNKLKAAIEFRRTHYPDGTLITSQNSDSSSLEDIGDSGFQQMHEPLEKLEQRDYLVDEKATRKYRNKKSLKKEKNSSFIFKFNFIV